jgi:hypothetical protein
LYGWNIKLRNDEELMLRRYLLGDLDEPMTAEIEIRLLEDSKYAGRLSTVEDNLVDDYVFEILSEPERKSFNANFLVNNERRNKIMMAQAMKLYLGERSGQGTVHERFSLSQLWHISVHFLQAHKLPVILSVVVITVLAILVPHLIMLLAPNVGVSPLNAQRTDIERRIAELNRHNNDTRPLVQISLQPLVLRESNGIGKLVVNRNTAFVSINLQLPPGIGYDKYRAMVQTIEGKELFAIDNLKSAEGVVTFKMTADILRSGDYQIELIAETHANITGEVARYNLRVISS